MATTELNGLTWHGMSSSNISRIAFDPEHKILYVEFHHGGTYAYENVSGSTFHYFLNAPSAGRYFQSHIRSSHSWRKVS